MKQLKGKKLKCKECGNEFIQNYNDQLCCSAVCLVNQWDALPGKVRTKRKARTYSHTLGFRSMSEVRYNVFLEAHGIRSEYEPDTFKYTLPQGKYTPDFKIPGRLRPIYLEYKGVFTGKDRRKLRYVRMSNPDVDIRLVFERSANRLSKYSKTTYGEWATKNKFKWYDATNLDDLMKELGL